MHPNLINQWRAQLLEGAADIFGLGSVTAEPAVDVTVLHAKIGELTLANDLFGRCAQEGRSVAERKAMINCGHALPLVTQARQLGISRGSIYYLPRAVPDSDLAVMRRIDELYLLYPFVGSRMLRDLLRQEGTVVGRLHVAKTDEADADQGNLSPPEYVEAGTGAQDLSVPAAQSGSDAPQLGLRWPRLPGQFGG